MPSETGVMQKTTSMQCTLCCSKTSPKTTSSQRAHSTPYVISVKQSSKNLISRSHGKELGLTKKVSIKRPAKQSSRLTHTTSAPPKLNLSWATQPKQKKSSAGKLRVPSKNL